MKIKAIAPWFGSKRGMALEIVRQLGSHRRYWEPFCGSMAVLLAKGEVSQETVNDLHGDLINLALVLQHRTWGPWLYRKLRRALVHEEMHRISKAQCADPALWLPNRTNPDRIEEADAKRAFWFFYASWLGRNGVIGTRQWNNNFCIRWTGNGGIQGTRFASAVDSIPAWRRRLREVTILSRDGFDLLEKIEDQDGTAIYCDPPYLRETRSAKNASAGTGRSSGSGLYIHEFEAADHARLAGLLRRFRKARVVVSYYADPRLAELYPGWTILDCSRAKSLSTQGQRGSKGKVAPEVLLINGPAEGAEGSARSGQNLLFEETE